ncbi:superoxide dismutase [Candidatus Falkowbacteria bacterium]|nr:superoxide dismutase [Candidatus Falkowbacteria bacterium]
MFELPKLSYAYDALEPFIDAKTMEIHHSKHHQTYVTKLNEALDKHPELADWSLMDLLTKINDVPQDIRKAVQNHGGGHYNHTLFWLLLNKDGQKQPSGELAESINATFGSYDAFKEQFTNSALGLFGSGWTWLIEVRSQESGVRKLQIINTANQDCPLMNGQTPIIGLDVWAHAYYLKHQNKRADYIKDFWEVLDWSSVK